MVRIASHVAAIPGQKWQDLPGGHKAWRTEYIGFSPVGPEIAQGWMLESSPQRVLREHFHEVDQFQVIVEGEGMMGRHHVQPGVVHFSRAYTPYGPILWGDQGMQLLTIRPRPDTKGAHYMPDNREELNTVRRKPFQTSHQVVFPETSSAVHTEDIPGIQDDAGLLARAYTLKAGAQTLAPDPSTGGGQWILVMKGSMMHEGKAWPAFSIAEVTPDESAYRMQAGPEGLHAIVLSFSRPDAQGANSSDMKARATGASTWICELCGFVYDEAAGIPDEGIAPGTRWEDVPETWTCPDCATTKSDFKMVRA